MSGLKMENLKNSYFLAIFTKRKISLILFAVLVLMNLTNCQTNYYPLKINGESHEYDMEDRGFFYYKLQIPDDYDQKSDVIISITPTDSKSDPDLHISSTNQKPSNLQDSEFSCAIVGEDICTVPSSQLSAGKNILYCCKMI